MKNIINKIRKNEFFLSISMLASGSIISQIITFIASPIMTRMFTPAEIGGFTLILTANSIFSPILSLRYDLVIVSEVDEKKCFALIKLSMILCLMLSLLITVGYEFYFIITNSMPFNFVWTFFILFLLLFTTGMINILTSFNNRMRQYKLMSKVNITRSVTQNGIMFIMGYLKSGVIGLTLSQLIGLFVGVREQSRFIIKQRDKLINIDKGLTDEVLKKYNRQILWSTPAALLNSYSYSSLNLFIQSLYGSTILGLYSLSFRALGVPLNVISNNVSRVYYERATAEKKLKGCFTDSLLKTCLFILPLSILMLISLMLIGPQLIKLIFGESWDRAGDYIRILSILFSIRLIASCIGGPSLILGNRQDYDLKFQIMLVAVSIGDFVICKTYGFSIEIFLIIYSALSSLINLYSIYICFKISQKR